MDLASSTAADGGRIEKITSARLTRSESGTFSSPEAVARSEVEVDRPMIDVSRFKCGCRT